MLDQAKSVVFINGAWMTSACWNDFKTPFTLAGYTVHTLERPYLTRDAQSPRMPPPAALGGLSIKAIVAHHARFIRSLATPPLIVGHSFGALFVQLLLDQGLGCAGIAIDPAPLGGLIPGPLTTKAALPVIARVGGWHQPNTLPKAAFGASFANTAPAAVRDPAYGRLVVPTSGLMFYQNALSIGTFVSPKRRTVPLLITSAEKDRTVSPYVCKAAYRKQKRSAAATDFLEFAGMSHFLIAERGWEKVASACLSWSEEHHEYHDTGTAVVQQSSTYHWQSDNHG